MDRITRELMLLEMAYTASKRGTCRRLSVGAIIARESRPISLGYVGAPPGAPHCDETNCDLTKPCNRTNHAEYNAIEFAVRHGIVIAQADMFTTDAPCIRCSESIVAFGLARVYFHRPYRLTDGIENLIKNDIEVHRLAMYRYHCEVCKSGGFNPSITGRGCTFCDGSEGGRNPFDR